MAAFVTLIPTERGGGRDNAVGIATRHGPDGHGIESLLGGEIFHNRPDRPWSPQASYTGVLISP